VHMDGAGRLEESQNRMTNAVLFTITANDMQHIVQTLIQLRTFKLLLGFRFGMTMRLEITLTVRTLCYPPPNVGFTKSLDMYAMVWPIKTIPKLRLCNMTSSLAGRWFPSTRGKGMLSALTLNGCRSDKVEMDDNLRIWRTFSIGTLFDLIMLDTRHYDRSITGKLEELKFILSLGLATGRSILEH